MQQFAVDKALAAIYEGIAIQKIERWYLNQGLRIQVRYNEANGLEAKRGFDLIDTNGKTFEVKCDKISIQSERIFVSESLRFKSTADYVIYLIPPGGWILPRQILLDLAISGSDSVGDNKSEFGDYVDLEVFQEVAELI